MSKRGPKPLPAEIKLARGTFRKSVHGDPATMPQPEKLTTIPRAPKSLGAAGRTRWKEDGQRLIDVGVLSILDLPALELYCKAWDEAAGCEKVLAEDGDYITTDKGFICAHPAIGRMKSALDRIRRYQQEFGLTPSARTGINVINKSQSTGKVASRSRA